MGVVFRARDLRLGRDVAVKLMRPRDGAGAEVRRLFDREARATAQLLHPNIVTLHHVGEHEGVPYLVLELLTGETLAARLARRGALAPDDALAILDAVLGALAFAHERGVLHRDLKPNNVFITADERVKVLDFGVALSLDTDPGPATRSAGTPGYMAPEQRDGGAQDARTDVWAAALLLVECLVGRRCDERTALAAVPTLPLPSSLRADLSRALDVDPARRPETAGELRATLGLANRRLAPAIPPPARWRRNAQLAAFGLGAAILGAIGLNALTRRSPTAAAITGAEVSGAWSVNFGRMELRVERDGTAYGVYEHDDGILVGRYRDGLFLGRWCELPSRRTSDDTGILQLHFARGQRGLVVEGRWTYGDALDAQWHAGTAGFFGDQLARSTSSSLLARLDKREPCP